MALAAHDPRLALAADDLFGLSAALSITVQYLQEPDRARFEQLALKLAAILALLVETVPVT